MIAMKVRREKKEYEWDGTLGDAFRVANMHEMNAKTFLYIRNGENLYMMACDLEFGEKIFPDHSKVDLSEPQMISDNGRKFMPQREWEVLREQYLKEKVIMDREQAERRAYMKSIGPEPDRDDYDHLDEGFDHEANNKLPHWDRVASPAQEAYNKDQKAWRDKVDDCPHGGYWYENRHLCRFNPGAWQLFDYNNIYYDDAMDKMTKEIKQYNRIALIIQGLFDRSEVLHPHPPVKTWTHEGFMAAIELVYDSSNTLHYGEAPDFESYCEAGRAQITKDSVLIGQQEAYLEREAEKENRRTSYSWREDSTSYQKFSPYGNPGPGYLAIPAKWQPNIRRAKFTWWRERQTTKKDMWGRYVEGQCYGDPIRDTITVEADKLFNVSAYQPGDYKLFFDDPRTRVEYLKWAPLLLAAERYYMGKADVSRPIE
jgi:hypothetical protein